jgi:DNA-binding IclR family transcriptional regulator
VTPARLREVLDEVRRVGYAAVVDELEYGITGLAVPLFDGSTVVGAVSCVTPSGSLQPATDTVSLTVGHRRVNFRTNTRS